MESQRYTAQVVFTASPPMFELTGFPGRCSEAGARTQTGILLRLWNSPALEQRRGFCYQMPARAFDGCNPSESSCCSNPPRYLYFCLCKSEMRREIRARPRATVDGGASEPLVSAWKHAFCLS